MHSSSFGKPRRVPLVSPEWQPTQHSLLLVTALLFTQLLTACAQSAPREVSPTADSALASGAVTATVRLSGDEASDRAQLDSLNTVARELARRDGCSSADGCATIALGSKACGGPREYLVYCRASTDTVALANAVELVSRLEREFNERYQVMSDCMMLLEPGVALEGGACVASTGLGGSEP